MKWWRLSTQVNLIRFKLRFRHRLNQIINRILLALTALMHLRTRWLRQQSSHLNLKSTCKDCWYKIHITRYGGVTWAVQSSSSTWSLGAHLELSSLIKMYTKRTDRVKVQDWGQPSEYRRRSERVEEMTWSGLSRAEILPYKLLEMMQVLSWWPKLEKIQLQIKWL